LAGTARQILNMGKWSFIIFVCILIISPLKGFAQETCCERDAAAGRDVLVQITMPEGQTNDRSGFMETAFESVFTKQHRVLHDCPLRVYIVGNRDPDYIFLGTITVDNITGIEEGDLMGRWTLKMQLIDPHRGSVIKEHEASWGFYSHIRSIFESLELMRNAIINLAKSFMSPPLDEALHDYERMPESCTIELEKEEVESGEEITITVKDINDSKGRGSQSFQRVLAKVEKGEINNGIKNYEEYSVFEVKNGQIELQYQAPDECKEETETITIYNSCNINEKMGLASPANKIEEKEFEIVCNQWEGTIDSRSTLSSSGDESLITAIMPKSKYQAITNWKLDVVFKLDRGNERVRIYELKSARFNFSDKLESELVIQAEAGKTQIGGESAAEVKGRNLSPSECDLKLVIDLKKKTYKIEGLLHVKNIQETVEGELNVDYVHIQHDEKDEDEVKTEYKEEILIEGEFSEDSPEKLEGNLDEMKEIPPEFANFMEAFAGNITGKIRWKLERKGKR